MTPDQAWLVQPGESGVIDDPEVRRIRRVSAGGLGDFAIAVSDWEGRDSLSEGEQGMLNFIWRMAIKDPKIESGTLPVGVGLNRFGRNILQADDAEYVASKLPTGLIVYHAGVAYPTTGS